MRVSRAEPSCLMYDERKIPAVTTVALYKGGREGGRVTLCLQEEAHAHQKMKIYT